MRHQTLGNQPGGDVASNINREGKKIYHVPDSQYYIQTNLEKWFCTEEAARAAGFKKSEQ